VQIVGLTLPFGCVAALCVIRTAAFALFALGWHAREAGLLAGALGYVVLAQDPLSYVNSLHLLYAGTMVLALGGAGAALALRPEKPVDPGSGILLVRAFVASVYAWSGLSKLDPSWLRGETLDRYLALQIVRGPAAEVLLASADRRIMCAWTVAVAELLMGPMLLAARTRPAAIVAALALHVTFEVMVQPDVFGLAMAALLVAFVDARWFIGSPTTPPPTLV
jgi:hypothetical protein